METSRTNVLEQAASAVEEANPELDAQDANDSDSKPSQDDVSENPFKGTKHKIKSDKAEEEHDYDEVLRLASHGKAAAKRIQEVAEERKAFAKEREDFQSESAMLRKNNEGLTKALLSLRDNPDNILELGTELGVNFEEWAHKFIAQKIQYANMSDEGKRAHDLERENQAYKKRLEVEDRRRAEYAQQQEFTYARNGLINEMQTYLDAKQIAEPNPDVIERAIEIMKLTKATQEGRWKFERAYEHADNEYKKRLATLDRKVITQMIKEGKLTDEERQAFRELETSSSRKKPQLRNVQSTPQRRDNFQTIEEVFKTFR